MPHLLVAKKVKPNAKIDFYIGNLAPDCILNKEKKHIVHLRKTPDREAALKEMTLKTDDKNEYLQGMVLHLFVDWKWDSLILPVFAEKNGEEWYTKYGDEGGFLESYAFHHTDWAYVLWEQMDLCDAFDFVETDSITMESIKAEITRSRKWKMETKIGPSTELPPSMIEKFANDTAVDFAKWISGLRG